MTTTTTTTVDRPKYWTGVDAQDFEGGKVEIDWVWIDTVIENCGGDHLEASFVINGLATEAYQRGDLEDCAWLASMGMACGNYGVEL